MGDRSKIEWTDASWNPVTGCTKVSAGCKYCYAERMVGRFDALHGFVPFTTVECHPDRLEQPLHWKKPRRIFVVSMGDLFHEAVQASFIKDVFDVMSACPQHTFQVLTKRPERIAPVLFGEEGRFYLGGGDYLPNVWIGTSVENQQEASRRVPILLASGWTGVLWVSYEPTLGPVDLDPYLWYVKSTTLRYPRIHWVVCGGESGPKARPMYPAWALSVRDQCMAAGVPFFFKQWGEWIPKSHLWPGAMVETYRGARWGTITNTGEWFDGATPWNSHDDDGSGEAVMVRVGKKAAGRLLDGREWDEFPALKADEW